MYFDWDAHVCTYYCQGPTHAVPVLGTAGLTADDIAKAIAAEKTAGDGIELLSVRPAFEADVAAWQKKIHQDGQVWYKDGSTGPGTDLGMASRTVPFLVFVRLE